MTGGTLLPATVDYLVALFREAPTIGAADPPVEVIDGPMPNSGPLPLALWVGVDDLVAAAAGDATTLGTSEKTRTDFAGGREEALTVACVAAAWAGSSTDGYSGIRTAVAGIVTAVEAVVAADTGAPPTSQNPGVTGAVWLQRPINDGLQVFVPFQIIYRAL
jgi:hypothetical protein